MKKNLAKIQKQMKNPKEKKSESALKQQESEVSAFLQEAEKKESELKLEENDLNARETKGKERKNLEEKKKNDKKRDIAKIREDLKNIKEIGDEKTRLEKELQRAQMISFEDLKEQYQERESTLELKNKYFKGC